MKNKGNVRVIPLLLGLGIIGVAYAATYFDAPERSSNDGNYLGARVHAEFQSNNVTFGSQIPWHVIQNDHAKSVSQKAGNDRVRDVESNNSINTAHEVQYYLQGSRQNGHPLPVDEDPTVGKSFPDSHLPDHCGDNLINAGENCLSFRDIDGDAHLSVDGPIGFIPERTPAGGMNVSAVRWERDPKEARTLTRRGAALHAWLRNRKDIHTCLHGAMKDCDIVPDRVHGRDGTMYCASCQATKESPHNDINVARGVRSNASRDMAYSLLDNIFNNTGATNDEGVACAGVQSGGGCNCNGSTCGWIDPL